MVADDRESAAVRAYRRIRDDILDGTHRPGAMLGEAGLAAELGVSRTPVRAALVRLQDEGWITVYPKRGALVRGLSDRDVTELADARFVLETTAVDRAPAERRRELADRLEPDIDAQRQAFAEADMRRFVDLTMAFHRGFVEVGGNDVLLELYDRLTDRHRFALFAAGEQMLARCEEIIAEHALLIRHLRSGDIVAFSRVLRGHIGEVLPESPETFGTPTPSLFARSGGRGGGLA